MVSKHCLTYFAATLVVSLAIGCSDITHFESEAVEGRVSKNALYVYNKSGRAIAYFAVEREEAALIDWVRTPANGGENTIEAGTTKRILLRDVYGYERGDEILFYYWASANHESELYHFIIKTD